MTHRVKARFGLCGMTTVFQALVVSLSAHAVDEPLVLHITPCKESYVLGEPIGLELEAQKCICAGLELSAFLPG